jgi:hypothetical protein
MYYAMGMRYVLLMLFSTSCFAGDWSSKDTLWEAGYLTSLTIDCLQARDMNPKYKERNPLLGTNPSRGTIDNACALSAVGHMGISYLLPESWRRPWQVSTILVEVIVVRHQYQIGLKLNW